MKRTIVAAACLVALAAPAVPQSLKDGAIAVRQSEGVVTVLEVDLQKRIHEAVLTGKGWDQLPADVRRQVDNPEFQSILLNDPAKVIPDVRQPILPANKTRW